MRLEILTCSKNFLIFGKNKIKIRNVLDLFVVFNIKYETFKRLNLQNQALKFCMMAVLDFLFSNHSSETL